MSDDPPATTQQPPTGWRLVLAYGCMLPFLVLYVGSMIWDLIAWAIGGSAFLHTAKFQSLESNSVSLGGWD